MLRLFLELEHNHCASLNRWIVLYFISGGLFVGQIALCLTTQRAVRSIDQGYTPSNYNSTETTTKTIATSTRAMQYNILEMQPAIKREPTKPQYPSSGQQRTVCVFAFCVCLPCVHLCSAWWVWGRGQRSCGWSRCWLATASSPRSTGSRPSLPAPRTTALQQKR